MIDNLLARNYSSLDRLIHWSVFNLRNVPQICIDIESKCFHKTIANTVTSGAIFITSLPRAGTTILLNLLSQHEELTCHTYRNMPLVIAPIIWSKLTKKFRIQTMSTPRQHGDGIYINTDSPEAFEEIIWLFECPDNYRLDTISIWPETNSHIEQKFKNHVQRFLVSRNTNSSLRYLSKNNANIARIPLIKRIFPTSTILVPIRSPMDHAISLLNQHLHFNKIHATDSFTLQYMKNIGHFEFGHLHKPIMFEGMEDVMKQYKTNDINYWLSYWISAYQHLLNLKYDRIIMLDIEKLSESQNLTELNFNLNLSNCKTIAEWASQNIKPIRKRSASLSTANDLVAKANLIYQKMLKKAIN